MRAQDRFASPLADAPALPLLIFCCAFLCFDTSLSLPAPASACAALCISAGWCAFGTSTHNSNVLRTSAVLIVICLISAVWLAYRTQTEAVEQRQVISEGVAESVMAWGQGQAALVAITSGDFAGHRAFVSMWSSQDDIAPGSVISIYGDADNFKRASRDGGFDEMLYWRAKGADVKIKALRYDVKGTSRSLASIRAAIADRIREALPQRCSAYLLAALTGERDGRTSELHRAAGTSHLLAVSGFHVGIVFGLAWYIFRRFRCRMIAVSVTIWAYALITGASPSAVRAALMLQIVILGRMIGAGGRPFNTACAAGTAMLLWDPWLFWDVGWRLSMLSILTITSVSSAHLRTAKWLTAAAAVWLITSAQTSYTFGSAPLSGVVLNVFAVPLFAFIYPLAFVLSLPSAFGLSIGVYVARVPEAVLSMWEQIMINVIYIMPQDLDFSLALLCISTAAFVMLAARSSGFNGYRASAVSASAALAAAVMY